MDSDGGAEGEHEEETGQADDSAEEEEAGLDEAAFHAAAAVWGISSGMVKSLAQSTGDFLQDCFLLDILLFFLTRRDSLP